MWLQRDQFQSSKVESFEHLLIFFSTDFFRTEDEEQGDAEHSAVNVESHREENVNRQIQVRSYNLRNSRAIFDPPTLDSPTPYLLTSILRIQMKNWTML